MLIWPGPGFLFSLKLSGISQILPDQYWDFSSIWTQNLAESTISAEVLFWNARRFLGVQSLNPIQSRDVKTRGFKPLSE